MAQFFSALFFALAAIGAALFVIGMLRSEWQRVLAILAGEELGRARSFANPRVRVRVRAWTGPAPRRAQPLRAAA